VLSDFFMVAHRVEVTSLATRYRLPTVYPYRVFTEIGGLLSYGSDLMSFQPSYAAQVGLNKAR
jgi:putative ABC transport system substrate-binding protein